MAKCAECVHRFVCETLKGKIENSWAETCMAYRRKERFAEVVRCKDCKYGNTTMKLLPGEVCCEFHDFTLVKADDFCSCGERRNNVSITD